MKKYLLFAGDQYYPRGGWDDFVMDSDDLEELQKEGSKRGEWKYCTTSIYEWYQIVDRDTKKVIE